MENRPWNLDYCSTNTTVVDQEIQAAARFIAQALADLGGCQPVKVLDFGCGSGSLVRSLQSLGFDAWGCDIRSFWQESDTNLVVIGFESPLRLPFPDASFDAVISTSVLEHAQNKDEIFREIYRILAPGGQMLHLLPGKFYLPVEPHLFVPFVSWLWPHVPNWWLALWAMLGIRNEFQENMEWRQVVEFNADFIQRGLSYWTHGRLRRSVKRVFGNCQFPNRYCILHGTGGVAALCRKLPFKSLTGWASGQFRMGFLHAKKAG